MGIDELSPEPDDGIEATELASEPIEENTAEERVPEIDEAVETEEDVLRLTSLPFESFPSPQAENETARIKERADVLML